METKTVINNEELKEKVNTKINKNIDNNETIKENKNEKSNIKNLITLENILCLFIILCPIFDITSFIFRNALNTTISISTFVRPIIPLIVLIYIFVKGNKKEKKYLFAIGTIYLLYAGAHLYISKKLMTGCSYGTITNEVQYIFNFTFLIIDLIIYLYVFCKPQNNKLKNFNKNDEKREKETRTQKIQKLKRSITIMLSIYIGTIFLAIITKTSSYTYAETQTGFKGWIESGNSLSAILILSVFIIIDQIKTKDVKWRIFTIIMLALSGIYLTTLIGTRTGLFGLLIALGTNILLEMIFSKNKKIITSGIVLFIIAIISVMLLGSKTLDRRKQMNQAKDTIIDQSTGEVGNMTGDMLILKNKILDGTLQEGYMSEAQSKSVIDLYEYAKAHNIAGNDTRTQQLMYNIFLVKNQKNVLAILFGNGYKTNFREMVMENELASMILNFGIIGFILYVLPIIAILVYSIIKVCKNLYARKKLQITSGYIISQCALALSLVLSWLSGYVLFASSSMIVITVIGVILINQIQNLTEKN